MSTTEKQISDDDGSRRKVIIVVAIVAAVIIAGLFYFLMRSSSGIRVDPSLEGAIRQGSPEFADNQPKIVLDAPEATQSNRALGDIYMNLTTVARNFTGRTLSGLEIKGSVVDRQGKPVRERTIVVVPGSRQAELEPNRTILVSIPIEGLLETDDRANIKMEVTGFKFK